MQPADTKIAPLELWGGVECSVIRSGDAWRDQVWETGHYQRGLEDLDRIEALGIRTVRYPVVWERVLAEHAAGRGWDWHDQQLLGLQERGIEIVAGLIHHGSGPAGTDLLDLGFPEKLAAHARRVAERYPHLDKFTPVNEPLTTARFSCLYGHWYPHHCDEGSLLRALAVQARATLLVKRAILACTPSARFFHTEDIGRVFSTAPLEGQAAYENERRWLSSDLLSGKVDHSHPWRRRFEESGIPAKDLDELATGEAAPDIMGVNHYITSDRFLDHRLDLYPPDIHGSNGRMNYADIEAARVDIRPNTTGWLPRLREVWDRYRIPIVITEAHLGCPDFHDQSRWLREAWDAACKLRREDVDIRAVTAWALFGLTDWDSLVCQDNGHYEAGAFDASRPDMPPTPVAEVIRAFAKEGRYHGEHGGGLGWWLREDRFHAGVA